MACFAALSALGATLFLASASAEPALRIGTQEDFVPYVMRDDAGALSGFDVALMTELCSRMARDCNWETVDFDQLLPGVADGRFDLAIGGLGITAERRAWLDFSQAYSVTDSEAWFIGLATAPPPEQAKIAVLSGSLYADWLQLTAYDVTPHRSSDAVLAALVAGEADLALGSYLGEDGMEHQLAELGLAPQYSVEIPDEGLGIALCKGNDALRQDVDQALASMAADGSLDALDNHWFGP